VFLDSDMLINGPLDGLFDGTFDIGLTHRPHDTMPINGGILFVSRDRPEAARAFFDRLHTVYEHEFDSFGNWFGDQYALAKIVADRSPAATTNRPDGTTFLVGEIRVRLWPCDTHNFSPVPSYGAVFRRDPDRKVLHFKGDLKPLMPLYWKANLAWRASSSRLARVYGAAVGKAVVLRHAIRERLGRLAARSMTKRNTDA
jgi:hypothetical protein